MIDFLYRIDCSILLVIHQNWRCPPADVVFKWMHDSEHFVIPLALVWLYLMIFGGRQGRVLGLLIAIGLLLTDQASSQLLKPLVGRTRPCFEVDGVNALVHQVHSKSFPSGHATNNFGAATIFYLVCGRRLIWVLPLAAVIGFSRIYLGVHYPSDVFCGMLLGIGIGFLVVGLARKIPWLQLGSYASAPSEKPQASAADKVNNHLQQLMWWKEK